ncbi:hypothetical protein [Streptomyces africanus]|uniref:hypothetical protein n=1 Tax=Streptomyces africanus TaxID=231024 RepID=UPI0013028DAA|nr:hypothetical protein [Streptomyces africanus]
MLGVIDDAQPPGVDVLGLVLPPPAGQVRAGQEVDEQIEGVEAAPAFIVRDAKVSRWGGARATRLGDSGGPLVVAGELVDVVRGGAGSVYGREPACSPR